MTSLGDFENLNSVIVAWDLSKVVKICVESLERP